VVINQSGITISHSSGVTDTVNSLTSQANISIGGGSLALATTSTISAGLTISGGTLTGAGNLTIDGVFDWTGGTLSGSSSLTAAGGASIISGVTLDGRTLVIPAGTTATASDSSNWGSIAGINFATIVNHGTFIDQLHQGEIGAPTADGGGTIFDNYGSFIRTISGDNGTLNTTVEAVFNNYGSVEVQSGELDFAGDGRTSVSSGSFTGDPGSRLRFNGQITTLAQGVTGDLVSFGGTYTVAGPYQANTTVVGGPVTFTGTVGDSQGNAGAWTIESYATFSPASGGPATLTFTSLSLGGNGFAGVLSGTDSFVDSGAFTWSEGTLAGPQGSRLTAAGGASIISGVTLDGRTLINAGTATWLNSGTFTVTDGGVLDNLATGTFGTAGNTSTLALNGGSLIGDGTVNANVSNAGQVSPGGTGVPGALAINGSYSQASNGVLNIEIGGSNPGSQHDQLNVSGSASLGGTLNLSLLPNLGDVCGGTFAVINAAPLSGTFATINGLTQPGGLTLAPSYSTTSLTLTASRYASTTTVAASTAPSILNQPVTFTATVSAPAGATETPTGTVQFQIDGSNVGSPVTVTGGQAALTLSSLAVGPHNVIALYSGDGCFYTSSASTTQNVNYKFSGFLPPLSTGLTFAVNRTISIQFQLSDYNSKAITSLSAVTSLQIQALDANGNPVGAPFTPASTSNQGLQNSGGQYQFNWKTKGLAAGSYQIVLTLADSTTHTKTIKLTAGGSSAGLVTDGSNGTTTAGALLGGEVDLYVDNSNGDLTSDELARVQDAVNSVDATIAPYGVVINEVSDPTQANVTLKRTRPVR
jgi:hypothetical protein